MYFFLNMPHLNLVVRCPITSMFSSSSGCFSTCPNHLGIVAHIFSLLFAASALAPISSVLILSILFILIIHLSILTSVVSSKSYSSLPSAQVSFPYIRSGLMAVGYFPVTRNICPYRFERDDIVTGPPYAGVDRHNGEIVAFHLSR